MARRKQTYVLYMQFDDHRPRVGVFDTFEDAEGHLDAFEVSVFDPPQNEKLDRRLLRARIFECRSDSWGAEIDISAWRAKRRPSAEWIYLTELTALVRQYAGCG